MKSHNITFSYLKNIIILIFIATILLGCKNPLDKRFADTNYKNVIKELEAKKILSKPECDSLNGRIEDIIFYTGYMGKDNYEAVFHLKYGVVLDNATYRDIYEQYIRDKEPKPKKMK
jgi:hypothetical protein